MWSADFDDNDKTKQPQGAADTNDANDDSDDGFDDWAEFEDGADASNPAETPAVTAEKSATPNQEVSKEQKMADKTTSAAQGGSDNEDDKYKFSKQDLLQDSDDEDDGFADFGEAPSQD